MNLVDLLEQKLDRLLERYSELQTEVEGLRAENARLNTEQQNTVSEIDRILAKLDKV